MQATLAAGGAALTGAATAQGKGRSVMPKPYRPSRADVAQMARRQDNYDALARQPVPNLSLTPHWQDGGARFWYRGDGIKGAREFVRVESEPGIKTPAFDHAKLAAALAKATGKPVSARRLPFDDITFAGDGAIEFAAFDGRWRYEATGNVVTKQADTPAGPPPPVPPGPSGDEKKDHRIDSPDGARTAFLKDHNLWTREKNGGAETQLSYDGTADKPFVAPRWAPDSKMLVAFRVAPVAIKPVFMVESSPKDGSMRGTLHQHEYAQPGDPFPVYEPWSFDPAAKSATQAQGDVIDFGEGPPDLHWSRDSRRFLYEKTDRGHQRFRVISVDARTGESRAVIDETTQTFINTSHSYTHFLPETDEIFYISERDGWRHLYLYDMSGGGLKNQVTSGAWVVRDVGEVDEKARQIWFQASGVHPNQDPYLIHHYRINFDGTGLTALTDGDGTHTLQFSPDKRFAVDTYSRADLPPVHELRRMSDGGKICDLERANISQLTAAGWRAPEVFAAKGRDGKTDIWGLVFRPSHLDPARKYPLIENIYAGPHDSFVRKTFAVRDSMQSLAELGFIVVQCDGMGTRNRSKAFHNVCWRNLKDAGLPDRIAWMRALAQKHAYCDINRVGIYGTSAGGQSAMGALLFHPDFYKVAVSSCGCYDNRVDKRWWNEQWMGWPIGPWYAESSNVVHAKNLRGKLLLIVGELDTNVPPESTMRVADALIDAGKDFDLLVMPGLNHTSGGAYGERRRRDHFLRHLLGVEPPDRNLPAPPVPPVLLHARSPGEASVLPGDGGEGTTVTFKNLTRQPVTLYWVNGGRRTPYPTLAPGATHTQNTYTGHVWLIVGADGRALAVFVGEAKPGIAEIR